MKIWNVSGIGTLNLKTNTGNVQNIKGSSELHVSNNTKNIIYNLTSEINSLENQLLNANTSIHGKISAINFYKK